MLNKGRLYVSKLKESVALNKLPLKEYPRPNFVRNSYFSLNGEWELEYNKVDALPKSYSKKIIVPYALEAPLSGINYLVEPDDFIYYRKTFKYIKTRKNNRVLLNLDGIDMFSWIYLNGKFVGYHEGGYTKFNFDITDFILEGANELIIKVKDISDTSYHLRGKQVLKTTGYFYTTSSGIYKPVWIEEVPEEYIKGVKFTAHYDDNVIEVEAFSDAEGKLGIFVDGKYYEGLMNKKNLIKLENPHSWSYKDPFLYYVKLFFKNDEVSSYFGFRKIEIKRDKKNRPGIYLNNQRIILNGLLDQGYYFLGNLTPSSYDDYEKEILNLKELGYNTLRKHIKIENDTFYYLCDKYGMLLVQDFVNGGTPYKFSEVVLPRVFTPFINKESWIKEGMFGRKDKEGKEEFIKESKEIVDSLYNHPSIVVFTIFNEAWGEFDPSRLYSIFKQYDPTRLYDTASGWVDSKNSDFYSVHSYTIPARKRHDKHYARPYFLSETGGISLKVKDHSYFDGFFGHGKAKTFEALNKKYFKLYEKLYKQLKKGKLNGIIYTEVSDCEKEYNGIYTFDREVLKLDKEKLIELNKKIEEIY